MFGILKKEWKVFLNKSFLIMLAMMVFGGVMGAVFLKIILTLESESTYIYLGTLISIYVAGMYILIVMAKVINTRLNLLISFGKKRSSVIWYSVAVALLTAVVLYGITMVIFFLEKNIYSVVYASNGLESGFGLDILVKYGSLMYVLVAILIWFLYSITLRYGQKCFVIAYLVFMAIMLLIPKLLHADIEVVDSMFAVLAKIFACVTETGWVTAGIAASAVMVAAGYRVLKKYDVRY